VAKTGWNMSRIRGLRPYILSLSVPVICALPSKEGRSRRKDWRVW